MMIAGVQPSDTLVSMSSGAGVLGRATAAYNSKPTKLALYNSLRPIYNSLRPIHSGSLQSRAQLAAGLDRGRRHRQRAEPR